MRLNSVHVSKEMKCFLPRRLFSPGRWSQKPEERRVLAVC